MPRDIEVANAAHQQSTVVDNLRCACRKLYQRLGDHGIELLPVVDVHLIQVGLVLANVNRRLFAFVHPQKAGSEDRFIRTIDWMTAGLRNEVARKIVEIDVAPADAEVRLRALQYAGDVSYLDLGDFRGAVAYYRRLIALAPGTTEAWQARAVIVSTRVAARLRGLRWASGDGACMKAGVFPRTAVLTVLARLTTIVA